MFFTFIKIYIFTSDENIYFTIYKWWKFAVSGAFLLPKSQNRHLKSVLFGVKLGRGRFVRYSLLACIPQFLCVKNDFEFPHLTLTSVSQRPFSNLKFGAKIFVKLTVRMSTALQPSAQIHPKYRSNFLKLNSIFVDFLEKIEKVDYSVAKMSRKRSCASFWGFSGIPFFRWKVRSIGVWTISSAWIQLVILQTISFLIFYFVYLQVPKCWLYTRKTSARVPHASRAKLAAAVYKGRFPTCFTLSRCMQEIVFGF